MAEQAYDALRELAKTNENKALRLYPAARIEGNGETATLQVAIPLKDLALARRGNGQRRSLGFAMTIEFELPDGTPYQLYASWVSLTTR